MAAAVQPSGLMDIASSLTQDEIPFKLRCAICNKLAVNAFRLPCCDQAICENCQSSLPETCPVCAHTPISSDLCKPNKALRTTLKAFLRTEEKKREKERQAALPPGTNDATPAEEVPVNQDTQQESQAADAAPADRVASSDAKEVLKGPQSADNITPAPVEVGAPGVEQEGTNGIAQDEPVENGPGTAVQAADAEQKEPAEGDGAADTETPQQTQQETSQDAQPTADFPNPMGFSMNPGMFANMAWGANPMMAQFMGNGMMGFPNPMGIPGIGIDPMAASQGMFGGYGMMNGMSNGMNMGMNFNAGQEMYGGWDGSQNNMWNGSQDKFNPNAFANGMGAQFGDLSGFGGYNMSQPNGVHAQMQQQPFPNQDFQNGYYGPGNYRGRGRGYFAGGRGRGGYGGHMQPNTPHNANSALQDGNFASMNEGMPSQVDEGTVGDTSTTTKDQNVNDGTAPDGPESSNDPATKESNKDDSRESIPPTDGASEQAVPDGQELHGIPTIDSFDQANNIHGMPAGPMGFPGHMNQGFGRGGGYMRGGFPGGRGGFGGQQSMAGAGMQPRGPGVEGAPAAPRAMREGLPNTSVFRQRNFQPLGRGSIPPGRATEPSETPHPDPEHEEQNASPASRSASRARSRSKSRNRSRSRSRSRSNSHRHYRPRSQSVEDIGERDHGRSHPGKERSAPEDDERRARSPSLDSHRSSRHRDKGRDRRSSRSRRSHRSRRHRSRSRSRSPGPTHRSTVRDEDRLSSIREESASSRSRNRNFDDLDMSGPAHRSGKDHSGRREEDREKERDRERDSRRRDRERERERDRDRDRDRDRHRDRDRERERERERDRDRDRHRDRDRPRSRDRKRSRRDRSESATVDSDYDSRRTKRGRDDDARNSTRERTRGAKEKLSSSTSRPSDAEKDPITLEREARNRERLLKEQQRREAMQADWDWDSGKSSRRRDSRQERERDRDRAGRRLNYKYDDEADAARAARVEREREASRWA
ncbi:hypothetical protein BJX61DRAFT_539228 [Aspergillus egyptiacus]|nr:hypothetical protein BJX61DRAFT_539228 [Aspergillus egyptiacus]